MKGDYSIFLGFFGGRVEGKPSNLNTMKIVHLKLNFTVLIDKCKYL